MEMTDNAAKALKDSTNLSVAIEMTPERRERLKKLSCKVADIIKANTENPAEGYMVLVLMTKAWQKSYGIRGGIIMDEEDTKAKA